jgi:hypothetical protein
MAYPEPNKNLDPGLWKPEEKQEKPEHKLITGLFFFLLGVALLMGSCLPDIEPDLMGGLRILSLLTIAAGTALMVAYVIGKMSLMIV